MPGGRESPSLCTEAFNMFLGMQILQICNLTLLAGMFYVEGGQCYLFGGLRQ